MIRYTTPTHIHKVLGVDLTGCDVWVSYSQRGTTVNLKSDSVSFDGHDTTVEVTLDQKQTGAFSAGEVQVQINWVYPDNRRDAVIIKTYDMAANLMPKVVNYGSN